MPDSVGSSQRPILSLVVTGRNDEYMGDFKWRLQAAANINARNAAAIGRLDDVEIVVADWKSEVPLSQVIPLVPEAQKITRFILTPPSLDVPAQKDATFPDSIVINTAIRRARGEFIALTGADVVYTTSSLRILLGMLSGELPGLPVRQAFLTACRRHIPTARVNRKHPLYEFEAYIDRNAAFFPIEYGGPGHAAPTSMMLMHRDLWHASRGFDERLIYWGFNDIDLTIRMTQRYPFIHTDHFGVIVLHLEHWSKQREYKTETFFRKLNPADNLVPEFAPNDENWGLGHCELIEQRSSLGMAPEPVPQPGEVEAWSVSLPQIAQAVSAPELIQGVQTILGKFNGALLGKESLPAMCCLGWYAASRHPRAYGEVGFRYPHAAALVASQSPGTEIYACVEWERRPDDDRFFYERNDTSLIFYVTNTLRQVGHWAYTRYVGGDQTTAIQRLVASEPAPFLLDLILFRAGPTATPHQALAIANHLKPGGAMVVTANTPNEYQAVVGAVRERHPRYALLNFDGTNTGMLLAVQPAVS